MTARVRAKLKWTPGGKIVGRPPSGVPGQKPTAASARRVQTPPPKLGRPRKAGNP